ncbi:anti-sigma factor antagonist [Streptomyces sp. p1417]|uniref:Anti-sigma factor antagonist n=1 Tax=Streptomyces typhae TaxID=2681492 RepID=A0A6L6X4F0_9ACTN|nr:STAS domain-containing protein [Streptomyces typhae]MVO88682.1 anti-sigma factor antagonist [Streptomyces typhae]
MNPLNITLRDTAAGPVLHVAGELDYAHAATLRQQVDQLVLKPDQWLVIDLSGLEFCDSSGITALLAARQHAHTAGADIALAAVPAKTMRVLTIVGLDRIFTIRPAADTV